MRSGVVGIAQRSICGCSATRADANRPCRTRSLLGTYWQPVAPAAATGASEVGMDDDGRAACRSVGEAAQERSTWAPVAGRSRSDRSAAATVPASLTRCMASVAASLDGWNDPSRRTTQARRTARTYTRSSGAPLLRCPCHQRALGDRWRIGLFVPWPAVRCASDAELLGGSCAVRRCTSVRRRVRWGRSCSVARRGPRPSSLPAIVMTSMPACGGASCWCRRCARSRRRRPGATARKLLPSSHCSRSAARIVLVGREHPDLVEPRGPPRSVAHRSSVAP